MTDAQTYQLVHSRLLTEWTAAGRTEPLMFANESYTPPANAAWGRFYIESISSRKITGHGATNRHRRVDRAVLQLADIADGGIELLDDMVHDARTIFENFHDTDIDFGVVQRGYRPIDKRWIGATMEAEFTWYEHRA